MTQIDTNQLNQAKGSISLTQSLLTQAIEKSTSDEEMAKQAIKQASAEIAQAQTKLSQIQSSIQTQQAQQAQQPPPQEME